MIAIAYISNSNHKTHEKYDLFEDRKCINNSKIINKPINNFNFKLAKLLDNDYVYSPLGITFVLSLIHLGTYENTEKELNSLFEYNYKINELNDIYNIFNNDNIKMSNALLINDRHDINNKYIDVIKHLILIKYFNDDNLQRVVKEINTYIAKNTNNLIKKIIDSTDIDIMTQMIIINTIYFKANWKYKFDKNKTKKMLFNGNLDKNININNDEKIYVDMMHIDDRYDYFETDDIQIVEIPYDSNKYVMGIILPKNNNLIHSLTDNIDLDYFNNLVNSLSMEKILLYLPRFKHKKTIRLVPFLKKFKNSDTFLSDIVHEAIIIVDEDGTEAAAVTTEILLGCALSSKMTPIIFKADHPFIYYIRYIPDNIILFYGLFYG